MLLLSCAPKQLPSLKFNVTDTNAISLHLHWVHCAKSSARVLLLLLNFDSVF